MRFSVGDKVRVTRPYSGGNFVNGDVVTIAQIGNEDDMDCYGAISPYDKLMWFLNEDEVMASTKGDRIRAMSDEELAENISDLFCHGFAKGDISKWLKQPAEEAAE